MRKWRSFVSGLYVLAYWLWCEFLDRVKPIK